MELKILVYPNEILTKKSIPVKKENIVNFQKLAEAMIEVMVKNNGIGLAAPQIGKNINLIVINKEICNNKKNLILFNPKVGHCSKKISVLEEGCLSLPGFNKNIARSDKVRIKAYDENGKKIQLKAKGLFSHVLQHEIDHLHGILIINRE